MEPIYNILNKRKGKHGLTPKEFNLNGIIKTDFGEKKSTLVTLKKQLEETIKHSREVKTVVYLMDKVL